MKRIQLFPGATATVADDVSPETVEALTEMMRCVERMTMSAKDLRNKAKEEFKKLTNTNSKHIEGLVDLLIDAAVADIVENHMVDVPNTGYYGIIIKREKE